ncbi:DUF6281 family protein [Streptomyces sp. NPDC001698]|uniref:DUF6281 family protein n=1 Tax=Streptomyces sp. NPDC001698 TaxID=3364601 RepID=UPI0036BDAC6A
MRVTRSLPRDADRWPRSRLLPLSSVMVVAVLTAACSAQSGGGDCPNVATYEGRTYTYTDVAHVDFSVGDALGTAEIPPCNDTPGAGADAVGPKATTAYAVDGLDPRIAIAVRYTPDEVMLLAVQAGGSLPPEVEDLTRH